MNCVVCGSDFLDDMNITDDSNKYYYCNDCGCVALKDTKYIENVYDENYVNSIGNEEIYSRIFNFYKNTFFRNRIC